MTISSFTENENTAATGETPGNEFSHFIDIARMGDGHRHLIATGPEREALARRFDLVAINHLEASLDLVADGPIVTISGQVQADIVQSCAVSGEDLPVAINEPVFLRFVPETEATPEEEIELDAQDCDEIAYSGAGFDLGEAVAQSLALAIDPFATGPNAERVRKEAGLLTEEEASPFAALAALKMSDSVKDA